MAPTEDPHTCVRPHEDDPRIVYGPKRMIRNQSPYIRPYYISPLYSRSDVRPLDNVDSFPTTLYGLYRMIRTCVWPQEDDPHNVYGPDGRSAGQIQSAALRVGQQYNRADYK